MAKTQTHKSKYKIPEDFKKSQKPESRKDLKDYTIVDKNGNMNPYATPGKILPLVPRNVQMEVIDDSENMVPKIKDKDRIYKNIPEGEYDPKHAKNVFEKNQKTDTEEYMKKREIIDHGVTTLPLEEKLKKLSEADQERLIREYFRRKIVHVIKEQAEEEEEEEGAEVPAPSAEADDIAAAAPAEEPTTQEPVINPSNDGVDNDDDGEIDEKGEMDPQVLKNSIIKYLEGQSNFNKAKFMVSAIRNSIETAEPKDKLLTLKYIIMGASELRKMKSQEYYKDKGKGAGSPMNLGQGPDMT